MKFENILYENHDGILYLTLNRPEVRNALSPEMWNEIRQAVSYAKADDAVKVVIISGAGDKALASGADIREIHDRYYMEQMVGTATLITSFQKQREQRGKPIALSFSCIIVWEVRGIRRQINARIAAMFAGRYKCELNHLQAQMD